MKPMAEWVIDSQAMRARETEDNTYTKYWGDKQRALWYVMVFSGVVNWSSAFSSVV